MKTTAIIAISFASGIAGGLSFLAFINGRIGEAIYLLLVAVILQVIIQHMINI